MNECSGSNHSGSEKSSLRSCTLSYQANFGDALKVGYECRQAVSADKKNRAMYEFSFRKIHTKPA